MVRVYRRIEDKVSGVVPVEGGEAEVSVGGFSVPVVVRAVTVTEHGRPLVAVEPTGVPGEEWLLFTWREKVGEWVQYRRGQKTGARLKLQ